MSHHGQKGPESGLISSLTCAIKHALCQAVSACASSRQDEQKLPGKPRGNPASVGPTERVPVAPSDALSLTAEHGFQEQSRAQRAGAEPLLWRGYAGSQFPLLLPKNKNRCSGQPQTFSNDSRTLSR